MYSRVPGQLSHAINKFSDQSTMKSTKFGAQRKKHDFTVYKLGGWGNPLYSKGRQYTTCLQWVLPFSYTTMREQRNGR